MNPLVAILLGLAVLVIGTLGYFEVFGSASTDADAQNVTQVVQSVFANVAENYATNPTNFTGFDNQDVIQAGIVPSSWVPPGQNQNIVPPWGGAASFFPANINNGNNNSWEMQLSGVPQSLCARLAEFVTPETFDILIDGTALVIIHNPSYSATADTWPPAAATVQAACDAPTDTVAWVVSGQ